MATVQEPPIPQQTGSSRSQLPRVATDRGVHARWKRPDSALQAGRSDGRWRPSERWAWALRGALGCLSLPPCLKKRLPPRWAA